MKGLILKDFYLLTKYCRAMLIVIVGFIALGAFGHNNIFFVYYPSILAGLIPMTLMTLDERDKWNVFSLTLPYTKSQLVSVKYIFSITISLIVILLTSIVQLITAYNSTSSYAELILQIILISLFVSLIGPAVLFPLLFKLGVEKGKFIYYFVVGALASLSLFINDGQIQITAIGNIQSIIYAIVFSIVIFVVSWLLSIHWYKKREY